MRLDNVTIQQNQVNIINSLHLTIHPGEIFVLMGPSGSGKTTLLKGMAGLLPLSSGAQTWENGEGSVGLVFQEPRLFPHLTVVENIAFGLRVKGISTMERIARAKEFLKVLQLEGMEDRFPHQLSGGQQQRVSLGRSLILNPDLLLLDEPFASLDTPLRLDLTTWLFELQRERGFSILWVTHYIDEAFSVADRIGVLTDGALKQVSTPSGLFQHPASEKIASFLSLPNRFSRDQWEAWFQREFDPHHTNEMGWIPANQLNIHCESDTFSDICITGHVVKRKPGKEGYSIMVKSEDVVFEVNVMGWESVPGLNEKVTFRVPYDQILWYSK